MRRAAAAAPAFGTVISEAQPIGEPVITPADTAAAYSAPVVNNVPAVDSESDADTEPAPESDDNSDPLGNPAPVSDPVPANNPAPVNDPPAEEPPTTYTILINYRFADGTQAAPSWSAQVATGSTYTQDIQSPVVVGYTPDQTVVHVEASETKTYTVTYRPAEVDFTVKHYRQNVSTDGYTLANSETK